MSKLAKSLPDLTRIYPDLDECLPLPVHNHAGEEGAENLRSYISSRNGV